MTLRIQNRSRIGEHPGRCFAAYVLILSLATVGVVPSYAEAGQEKKEKKEKKDPREMQARESFAAGSYKEALEIYTKLYAEKLHPTYLRNIGRCYQNLNEPDRAISSFREYLRKAKDMPADERAEVEGYIKEMEDLQKKSTATDEPAKPDPRIPPVVEPPVNPPPQRIEYVQKQPEPAPTPVYKKGWFWGVVVGVVVVGTVGALAAGGVFSSSSNSCPAGTVCR
jgi:tetratricopeptide (TPR) repeat protein